MCSTELLMEYSSKLPVLFYLLFLRLIRTGFGFFFLGAQLAWCFGYLLHLGISP